MEENLVSKLRDFFKLSFLSQLEVRHVAKNLQWGPGGAVLEAGNNIERS